MSRISVAMATWNGARFLDAQLVSIAAQERAPDELVICDDGSSDHTEAQVRAFAERAPFPVRFSQNPERLGVTANFERALSLCEGAIVLFADQDDVWHADKIGRLVARLESAPECRLAFSDGRVVDAGGRPLGYTLWSALGFDAAEQAEAMDAGALAVFLRHVVAAGTTFAFRNEAWLRPFPKLHSVHDAWVALLCAATGAVAIEPAPLIDYRLHDGNEIGIRRRGLLAQLAQARRQVARNAFADDAELFGAAVERLREAPVALSDASARAVETRAAHARMRAALPTSLPARLSPVWNEWRRGGYRRFGYGWKSAVQDLLLRG